ncbi:MAG: acyl-CoA dehydrogenase family protein [Acidimicrobiales bacterium]|nr:acyl-CoA dehydrogenase family protein [Acidimicrobiales bacterium]
MILTTDHQAIRQLARDFANARIAPNVREWERQGGPPKSLYEEMGSIGLMGMTIDPAYGGSGLDFISYALAMEEISAVDGGVSNMMSGNNSPVAVGIAAHGSSEQKEQLLPMLCSGQWLGSFHLTEPHTGSDASAITTRAVRDGNQFILSGHKAFITGGGTSDIAMIVAVTNPEAGKSGISTFVTSTSNPGYQVIGKEQKLGHRTNDLCQVQFDAMRIPESDLLGPEGRGLAIALSNLSIGRIAVAAQAVGGARQALRLAKEYAKTRETFGKPIIEHQTISFLLAEMATRVEAARQMYLHAAALHDAGQDSAAAASMAKLFASEMAEWVASKAIQIHGGAGFLEDHLVEKIYRDVRVYQLYEGTSEIQKLVISRHLDAIEM